MDRETGRCASSFRSTVGFQARPIGPEGACTSAGWAPDGSWMYFIATIEGQSHLWRQRFPNGRPEQITFGPMEEEGLAVEPDGRSVITSIGVRASAIWIHDDQGERSLSSEGEIVADLSPPSFTADNKALYYLLRHPAADSGAELWRMTVDSGKSEAVFPGVSMLAYDVSPDDKQVVYATAGSDGKSQLWLAPVDRSSAPRQIGRSGETTPYFGPRGKILFQMAEGNANYLEEMNEDGSGRSKVVPYPISEISGISPGRKWLMGVVPYPEGKSVVPMDDGHSARRWTSAAHLRRLLRFGMVFEWKIPLHCGGSGDRDKSGAKPGDSGWSRGELGLRFLWEGQGRGKTG